MNNRKKENWRGGRKSQQETARETAATPSWKRSRRQPTAGRRSVRKSRLLFPVILLLLLVAFGIYIGIRKAPLHTHFVTLTLLGGSAHFDAAAAPEFRISESDEYFPVRTTSRQPEESFHDIFSKPGEDLAEADVVVIYLQTQIVAGADGDFYCLTKNSSPDLSPPSEYELLSELKQNLKEFCGNSKATVILLVDCPTTAQDQRLGDLRADFVTELLDWPNDEELLELVVMVSAAAGQQSAPGHGLTAFGQAVVRGFSTSAAGDDDELKVSEFCQFVEQETDLWVRNHRYPGGQQVQISPRIEKGSDDDFTLMKNVDFAAPSVASPETMDGQTAQKFTQLWQHREMLHQKLAWRWHPLLWQSATEYLIRGQKALMDGNLPSAKDLAEKAEGALTGLDSFTSQIVTDVAELNLDTGLPRTWFVESPNMSRLNDVWETAEPVGNEDFEAAEEVISENMKGYPFVRLGLDLPDEAEFSEVRFNRQTAEMAAARVLSVTASLQKTIAAAEERLLKQEDLIFTRSATGNDVGDESVVSRWQAIRRFAEIHQRAELTVQRSLTSVESLVRWAADYPLKADREFFLEWRDLLEENLTTTPDTSGASELLGKALGLANQAGPGSNGVEIGLRSNIFGLLVATRTLASQLHPAEGDEGFSVLELEQRGNDLEDWQQKTEQLRVDGRRKTDQLATKLSKLPEDRVNQVATYGRIRATLGLTNLSPASRKQLIGSLARLEKELNKEPDKELSDASEDTETSDRRDSLDAALWYVQYLNLFTCSLQEKDGAAAKVVLAAATMDSAASSPSHADIAKFGASVRDFWKSSRAKVKDSLGPSRSEWETRLRFADLYCRGFSAYDSELSLRQSPTKALHAFWQVSFCLVQTDRLLQSQWVRPNESPPWKENGWYARCAQIWLKQAEDLAKSLGSGSADIPDSLRDSFDKLGKRLNDSAKWSIKASPSVSSVSIGELDTGSKTVDVKVQMQGQHPPGGVAALRVLAASPGNTAAELVEISNNGSPLSLTKEPQIARIKVQRTGSLDKSECEPVSHVPSVFFRGREWQSKSLLTVDPCPPKEFVVERIARPNTASVTLKGIDRRPIVFILDMSYSMKDPIGAPRSAQAINTIANVISDGRFDKETHASLMVYGHRVMWDGTDHIVSPTYKDVFKNPTAGVFAQHDVVTEVERTKLSREGKAKFTVTLEKLRRLTPWGTTPLILALKQAVSGDNAGRDVVVVAVTDGEAKDPKLIPQLEDALEDTPNTEIVIVGFDLDPKANKQLLDLIKPLQEHFEISLSRANKDNLTETILKSLKPREYTISSGRSLTTDIQQEFRRTADGLPPSSDYLVSFADIEISRGSPIALGPGDHLSLEVDWNDREFVFRRDKNPRRMQAAKQPPADEPDTPSMLRSVKEPEKTPLSVDGLNRVQVFLMLDHGRRNRPVRQPAEIEFRLVHRDSYIRLPKIKEEFTSEWNAPGWKLTIDEWPTSDYVRVDAFWKMKRTTPEHVIDYRPIDRKAAEDIGGSNALPKALLSIKPLDGKLQVRLDRIPDVPYDLQNLVEDIRVEIGTRDLSEDNASFRPDEVTTTIRRTDKGSVIYEFAGTYTEEKLRKMDIAFTSRAARFADAFRLKEPLVTSE